MSRTSKVVDPRRQAVFVTRHSEGGVTIRRPTPSPGGHRPLVLAGHSSRPSPSRGLVATADTVTNKATISAEVATTPEPHEELRNHARLRRHGVDGRIMKAGNDSQYQVRGGLSTRIGPASTRVTPPFTSRWEDTLPCTWSAGREGRRRFCDQPWWAPTASPSSSMSDTKENGAGRSVLDQQGQPRTTVNYEDDRSRYCRRRITASPSTPTLPTNQPPGVAARLAARRYLTEPADSTSHYSLASGTATSPPFAILPELCHRHGDR